ncbi:hypothetical protein D3C77_794920 [compost metagenome]
MVEIWSIQDVELRGVTLMLAVREWSGRLDLIAWIALNIGSGGFFKLTRQFWRYLKS